MRIAIIGCGYVADFYARNLAGHPGLTLAGAWDHDPARLAAWCRHFGARAYPSQEALLGDPAVAMVLNLTNPRAHFAVSSAIIAAGKHLYSEKPLGMTLDEAKALVAAAEAKGVRIGAAPCNLMSETVQALAAAIRSGAIGEVKLAYANYDDGMIAPNERPWTWLSESGAPWPAKDEFEIGCTYEHAGYYLTVLAELFGPAQSVTAFASTQIADKGIAVDGMAPDFSVGCVQYRSGVVARVTAGLVAPVDKSLTVVGTKGTLLIRYLRNDREPILISNGGGGPLRARAARTARRVARRAGLRVGELGAWRVWKRPTGPRFAPAGRGKPVDFLRGVQDMADAIAADRPHRLSGAFAVHVVEMIEALQYPERYGHHRTIENGF